MSQTVVGIFNNLHQAQNAFDDLLDNGFDRDQVDISEDYGSTYETYSNDDRKRHDDSISGFFDSLFGTDDKNREKDQLGNYKTAVREGSMVTVHTQSMDRAEKARTILDRFGAIDTDGDSANYSSDHTSSDVENTNVNTDTDSTKSIPVIEEELQVGKREVEGGTVRVRSRIIERPVEESLRLRTEHVHVERNPVDRKATAAELENFGETEIEVTERSEEAVVNKEARVTEEINVHKEVDQRSETIHEDVRETEVDIDETTAKHKDVELDADHKKRHH